MKSYAALFSLLMTACTTAPAPQAVTEPWHGSPVDNNSDFSERILEAHNQERRRLGLASLTWNAQLAAHAKAYARVLARTRRFQHSALSTRSGEGENLWKGTSGAYSLEEMMSHFLNERRAFHPGIFPKVTKTASWEDVGHYTQMIWPTTREVGCALASARGTDWLVCRYAPQGNVVGQPVP